ncbi:MAG TPA: hypothetical protein VJ654_13025, partial [Noviherbaspirillum sp.]|nr:hypothetical protein [Noviherbaspirillum sp.]
FGAFAMCGMAYAYTKNKGLLNAGLAFGMIACTYLIMDKMAQQAAQPLPLPEFLVAFVQSPILVAISALLVMIYSAVVGIFGPLEGYPTDMNGVIRKIQDHAKNNRDSSN